MCILIVEDEITYVIPLQRGLHWTITPLAQNWRGLFFK